MRSDTGSVSAHQRLMAKKSILSTLMPDTKKAKAISLDRQDLFMIDQQIREPALMLIRQQR